MKKYPRGSFHVLLNINTPRYTDSPEAVLFDQMLSGDPDVTVKGLPGGDIKADQILIHEIMPTSPKTFLLIVSRADKVVKPKEKPEGPDTKPLEQRVDSKRPEGLEGIDEADRGKSKNFQSGDEIADKVDGNPVNKVEQTASTN